MVSAKAANGAAAPGSSWHKILHTPDRTPETVALQKLTKFVLFAGEKRDARGLHQKDEKSFGQKAVILRIYCGRPAFLRRKSGQKAVGLSAGQIVTEPATADIHCNNIELFKKRCYGESVHFT
jgi:hypothetical protein